MLNENVDLERRNATFVRIVVMGLLALNIVMSAVVFNIASTNRLSLVWVEEYLKSATNYRYRASDAAGDFARRDAEIVALRKRILELEAKAKEADK